MRIVGTGSALPHRIVTNDDLAAMMDTSDEWIRTRTGIHSRHVLTDDTLIELAHRASALALENAGMKAEDLDYILCSNVYGRYITPALSCVLQGEIGASCPALDINGACTGFIYALDLAEGLISAGRAETILILCAEEMSRLANWTDRSTCVLFGDGVGAAVVTAGEGLKSINLNTTCNVEFLCAKNAQGNSPFATNPEPAEPLSMMGQDVYRFAVSSSVEDLNRAMGDAGVTAEEVDFFVLHQANQRILDAVRMRLKQAKEKFPSNIATMGNTSSASIPILLDELNRSGAIKPGTILAMSAFGAGLTNGACVYRWG